MQPFDFFTMYCCGIIFMILFWLTFAALSVGSVTYACLFGFHAVVVLAVRDDIIQWMSVTCEA